jgi:hypothetical protein
VTGAFLLSAALTLGAHAYAAEVPENTVSVAEGEEVPSEPPTRSPVEVEAEDLRKAQNVLSKSIRQNAHDILRDERGDAYNLREEAVRDLKNRRVPLFDLHRVEMSGVSSTAKTRFGGFFDRRIQSSNMTRRDVQPAWNVPQEDSSGAVVQYLRSLKGTIIEGYRFTLDCKDATNETLAGALTTRGHDVIRELKDKKIEEIYAHSWGSELIYNGILTGDIEPPKKLVVVGVPDRDYKKWELLQKYAGTEVVFAKAPDMVQMGGEALRVGGNAATSVREWKENLAGLVGVLPKSSYSLERMWAQRYGGRGPVRADKLRVLDFDGKNHDMGFWLGHNKDGYYGYLIEKKVLVEPIKTMRARQEGKIRSEMDSIWGDATSQAKDLVEQAAQTQEDILAKRADARAEAQRKAQAEARKREGARIVEEELQKQKQSDETMQRVFQEQLAILDGLESDYKKAQGLLRQQEEEKRKRDAEKEREAERKQRSEENWNNFFKALDGMRAMARELCSNPKSQSDFSEAIAKANQYGKTYYDGLMSRLQQGYSDALDHCAYDTLYRTFSDYSPNGSKMLTVEDFRQNAMQLAPKLEVPSQSPGGDPVGGENPKPEPTHPCLKEGERCIKW